MKVRILKTAAGPAGCWSAGQIVDMSSDALVGLEYELIERPVQPPQPTAPPSPLRPASTKPARKGGRK